MRDPDFLKLANIADRLVNKSEKKWRQALEEHVIEFNLNHAVVIVGGMTRIMRKTIALADIDGREGFEFLKPQELNAVYSNTQIKVDEKTYQNGTVKDIYDTYFNAWFKHPKSDVYRSGVIFRPGLDVPKGYFNTWQGFAVTPLKTVDYPKLTAHIDGIICQHNQELIDYFYSWVAYTLQNPHKVVGSALVLRGKKGVGKGIVGHFLRKIWGRHSLYISQASQITGNFNGHLADVCFLFADEAFFSGDKRHEGTLKALVTENKMMIERKGVDPEQQNNYLKLFMVTNNDYAVPATQDERRWGVFDVSDSMAKNSKYFKALRSEIKQPEVIASFMADMLAYDVSKWQASEIPESYGLKEQRAHSLPTTGKWLLDSLLNGTFNDDGWKDEISAKELNTSYLTWCSEHKVNGYEIANSHVLGRYLGKFFGKRKIGTYSYTLGQLSDCIDLFQKIEKIDIIE